MKKIGKMSPEEFKKLRKDMDDYIKSYGFKHQDLKAVWDGLGGYIGHEALAYAAQGIRATVMDEDRLKHLLVLLEGDVEAEEWGRMWEERQDLEDLIKAGKILDNIEEYRELRKRNREQKKI